MRPLLFPRTLAALLLVLLPLPSFALPRERDSWLRVESAHFVFFSRASERSSRHIAINLERLRDVLVQLNPGMEHVILQELAATAPNPEDAEKARKLAAEVEEFLKKQPKKKC